MCYQLSMKIYKQNSSNKQVNLNEKGNNLPAVPIMTQNHGKNKIINFRN